MILECFRVVLTSSFVESAVDSIPVEEFPDIVQHSGFVLRDAH